MNMTADPLRALEDLAQRVQSLLTAWGELEESEKRDAIAADIRSFAASLSQAGAVEGEQALVDLFNSVYEREWDRAADEADDRKKAIMGPADDHATRMAIRALLAAAPAAQPVTTAVDVEELASEVEGRARHAADYGLSGARAFDLLNGWSQRIRRLASQPREQPAAQAAKCATCDDHGLIGGIGGQTPENVGYWAEPCPDCTPKDDAPAAQGVDIIKEAHQVAFEIGGTEDGEYHFNPDELEEFVRKLLPVAAAEENQ